MTFAISSRSTASILNLPTAAATGRSPGSRIRLVGLTAWEPTPWRVVQRAAWETLNTGETG